MAKKCQHLLTPKKINNPKKQTYICSDHFSKDNFVRDLRAKLLEYKPKIRYLKQNLLLSLNLLPDHSQTPLSESSLNRRNRMNAKHIGKTTYLFLYL